MTSPPSGGMPPPSNTWWQRHPVLTRVLGWIVNLAVLALGDGR